MCDFRFVPANRRWWNKPLVQVGHHALPPLTSS
jgi:hypothetical protein